MSTGKRTLASLKDFTQAPNSRAALETLLYGDDVDYKGLRYVFFCVCMCGLAGRWGGWKRGTFIEEGTCVPRFFCSAFANLIVIFVTPTAGAQPQAHAHAHI